MVPPAFMPLLEVVPVPLLAPPCALSLRERLFFLKTD